MKSLPSIPSKIFETACLGLALVLVLVIAGTSYRAWSMYGAQREQMLVSAAIRIDSMSLQSAMKDAETGQRGFLLTGQESYLEPYREATREVSKYMQRLLQETSTRPTQLKRAQTLGPLVAAKMAELQQTIDLRRAGETEAAIALVRNAQGKAVMDEIRALCDAMEMVATERYRELAQEVASTSRQLGLIATGGSAALFGLLALATLAIHRGRRRRESLIESLGISENECREARDWLATTLNSIGDGVIATDAEGKIVFMNPVAQTLTGWSEEEAKGVPLEDAFVITNEDTGATVENPATRALREGRIVGLANHTELTAKGGGRRPIDDSAAPIRDEKGEVSGVVLVFRDVSERKESELALEHSIRQFQVMADHAPVMVWIAGIDKKASWFNRPWLEFVGRTLAEELAHDPAESEHPDDHARCVQVYQEAFDQRTTFRVQYRLKRKDGIYRWMLGNGAPLYDSRGVFTGYICSCTDITDQKLVEEKLLRANEDLNQFAYAASHDLQEPLRMITSYSQLLVKEYASKEDEEAAMSVGFITQGTKRMRALLSDLLTYTQVNEEVLGANELVDLGMTLRTALANLQAAISETGATVTADPLPIVRGHAAHFAQLFQNLIGNAIKYRGERAPAIHISAARQGSEWHFAVVDNGIGIEREYQEQIFGVFKRLHGKEVPGTGIGLAICQRVVERYDGRIWVESELGKGSRFCFVLPAPQERR
jgi:PAS domain S-box-containing protein